MSETQEISKILDQHMNHTSNKLNHTLRIHQVQDPNQQIPNDQLQFQIKDNQSS